MRPNSVPEGNLLISLDVVDAVDAEQGLAFAHALLFHLRQVHEIGPGARIEVVHLARGTIWAQVAIIVGTLVVSAGVIRVAVDSIRTEIEQGSGPLATETARTLRLYRGGSCTIVTQDGEITIGIRATPAYTTVAGEPPAPPEGFAYVQDGGAYVRNDGELVVVPREGALPRRPAAVSDQVYTNIPADGVAELSGEVVQTGGELRFVQPDGRYGRIDKILSDERPPHRVGIVATVSATRGEQGGYADRGVAIHDWKPLQPRRETALPSTSIDGGIPAEDLATSPSDPIADPDKAELVALVGQLDNSSGAHPFEFISSKGDTFTAEEADDFVGMVALGQDVFIEATQLHAEEGPLLCIHRLRVLD